MNFSYSYILKTFPPLILIYIMVKYFIPQRIIFPLHFILFVHCLSLLACIHLFNFSERNISNNLFKIYILIHYIFHFYIFFYFFQTLTGNTNTYSEVENVLHPIVFASKVRLYPYSLYDRTVCLRAEIVGCAWEGKLFIS